MTRSMSRREFILMSGAALAAVILLRYDDFAYAHSLKAPGDSWNQGELVHLIPIVNHAGKRGTLGKRRQKPAWCRR
jgi:hypothetical protein